MGNQIEGRLLPGQKVILVEDLISTGGSSWKAVAPIREQGCEVLGVVAIFDYGFDVAKENFKQAGVSYYSLSNYETMLPIALKQGYIKSSEIELLREWRKAPERWGN